MFDAKNFIKKAKPILLKASKKSGIFAKNVLRRLKEGKVSRSKIKNVISALDESKTTRKWMRLGLFLILGGVLAKKAAEVYDEDKTFKQNMKSFVIYIKKMKKRLKKHEC